MKKAVVIGGGWAGLAAATKLIDKGWKVTLIERTRQLGGRSSSFWDESFGEWLDHGPHVFIGAYKLALGLLNVWGSVDLIDFDSGSTINWLTLGGKRYKLGLSSSLAEAALGFAKFGYPSLFEKLAITRALTALVKYQGQDATLAEILEPFGANRGKAGEFFEALCVAVMNAPTNLAAAKPMAESIRSGLLIGGDAGRIGLPRRSLKEIVADPAEKYLTERGVEIKYGCEVKSITRTNSQGFLVKFDGGEIETDVTIIALPPIDCQRLLLIGCGEDIFSQGLSNLSYAPIAGVHFNFDKPILDVPFGFLSGGFGHWVFGRGERLDRGWSKASVVISYVPNRDKISTDEMAEKVLGDLKARLPLCNDARVLNVKAVRTVRATVVLTPDALKYQLSEQTKCLGLFLAGDSCDTGLPATIESAARSGNRAAELATKEVK